MRTNHLVYSWFREKVPLSAGHPNTCGLSPNKTSIRDIRHSVNPAPQVPRPHWHNAPGAAERQTAEDPSTVDASGASTLYTGGQWPRYHTVNRVKRYQGGIRPCESVCPRRDEKGTTVVTAAATSTACREGRDVIP